MRNILVLGGTGMLGHEFIKALINYKHFNITATSRDLKDKFILNTKKKIKWIHLDVETVKIQSLKKILHKQHYIINCIGLIKPYIKENSLKDLKRALKINSIFPAELNETMNKSNCKIFQIATDCVFSGNKGNYNEKNLHDASDVYGKSKSLGEINNKNFFNIRCSIIGPELKNFNSLYEWFKKSTQNSKLSGFINHQWNGLTTKAYAYAVIAIIKKKIQIPNLIHLIPADKLNKFEIIQNFKLKLNREDIKIKKVISSVKINRTLSTLYKEENYKIWKNSIYKKAPSIQKLILEM
jgi:dTDP-4-dehydrorhamnose reductase